MEPPTITHGRRISASNSPEFEFWMIRNPSSQQPSLHSADELFCGGVLLPLQLLTTQNKDDDKIATTESTNTHSFTITPNLDPVPGSDLKTILTASKRWTDIFRKNPQHKRNKEKKKKERSDVSGSSGGTSTAELNINLWPFSRSRSAGNNASRQRAVVGNRKVSSAPCSRSNSTSDKYRKWPGSPGPGGVHIGQKSPGRGGVHLGRGSPVWQVKGLGQSRSRSLHDNLVRSTAEKVGRPGNKSTSGARGNGKVLNNNVPSYTGDRRRMSCGGVVINTGDVHVPPVIVAGEGGGGSLFNLRSLFTKKVF